MTYALLVIGFPGEPPDHASKARQSNLLRIAADALQTIQRVEWLAHNVWLIPLESDLPTFCYLVHEAKAYDVPSRTFFFDKKPSVNGLLP